MPRELNITNKDTVVRVWGYEEDVVELKCLLQEMQSFLLLFVRFSLFVFSFHLECRRKTKLRLINKFHFITCTTKRNTTRTHASLGRQTRQDETRQSSSVSISSSLPLFLFSFYENLAIRFVGKLTINSHGEGGRFSTTMDSMYFS